MRGPGGTHLRGYGPVVPLAAAVVTLVLLAQVATTDGPPGRLLIASAVTCYVLVLGYFGHLTVDVGRRADRLETLVETDALTGLPNRRAWDRLLPTLDADTDRAGLQLALVVLDLDHFKHVNDQRGHAGGDAVLTAVAAAWRRELPGSALVVRWGGEEFVAALRVTDLEEAVATAERMRTAMPDGITCSAGLVLVGGDEPSTAAFARADAALYRAKDRGRDRLVVASDEAPDRRRRDRASALRGPVPVALGTLALTGVVALAGFLLQTVLFVAALAAAATGVVAARRRGTSVLFSSRALLVGFGLVILGQIAEAAGLGGTGRATPPDGLYLVGWATIAVATVRAGRLARGRQIGSGLDAAVVVAGLTTAVLLVLSQNMPIPWYGAEGLTYAVWPLIDVALLALFVWLGLSPELREVEARLMPVVLGVLLVTDTAVAVLEPAGRYRDGDPLDAGWFLAIAILAIAASASSRRTWRTTASDVLPSWRATALAVGTLSPVAGLLLVDLGTIHVDAGTLLAAAVLTVLLVVRIWTLLRLARDQSTALAAASRRDPLTGLANRRGWTEHAAREFALAGSRGRPLVVVMIDLDDFSEVNARLGHVGGDDVLWRAAEAWGTALRANDVLARWGGEEFIVLMPDCTAAGALPILERLRAVSPDDAPFSAGVATTRGGETIDDVVARADDALYAAKRAGRNRTTLAVPSGAG